MFTDIIKNLAEKYYYVKGYLPCNIFVSRVIFDQIMVENNGNNYIDITFSDQSSCFVNVFDDLECLSEEFRIKII